MGTYALDNFQQSEKRAHVQRRHAFFIEVILVLSREWTHTQYMSPELSLRERNILGLGAGIGLWALVEVGHLRDVGIELLYSTHKLTYANALGLLKYIHYVVLFLLSRVDWKRGEKVKHHTVAKQLTQHSSWALQRVTLKVDVGVAFRLLADDLVSRVLALRRKQV